MIKLCYDFRLISKDNFKCANRQGRFFLSAEFRHWEEKVRFHTALQYHQPLLTGDLKVTIVAAFRDKRHGDCQNLPKGLLDSLEGAVYLNDRQIKKLECVVLENEPKDRFAVTVENWTEEDATIQDILQAIRDVENWTEGILRY